jgi:hypothetical protein
MRAIRFCLAMLPWFIAAQSHAREIVVHTVTDLRLACSNALPGDVIQIPSITLTMDNAPLILPNNVIIRGTGQASTTVNVQWCNGQGTNPPVGFVCCAWELGNGTAVENLKLVQLPTVLDAATGRQVAAEQSETIGYGGGPAGLAGNSSALLSNMTVSGLNWPVYSWSGDGNNIRISDCTIIGGRTLVANCNSSSESPAAGMIEINRTHFIGNSSLVTYDGGFGPYLQTVVSRGGPVWVLDSDATLTGDPTIAVVQNNWTGNAPVAGSISFRNFHSRINPNGAKDWADFNSATSGLTTWLNCYGSGVGRALVISRTHVVEKN